MNKRNRSRLLKLASLLGRWASCLRRYVASKTPRRGPRKPKLSVIGVDAA